MLSSWTSRALVLLFCLSQVVICPTTLADPKPAALPLYISDTIPGDSAAALAAAKFTDTPRLKAIIQTQALHNKTARLPTTGIVLAPLQQWQQQLPALSVLRLPFYYPDLAAVHTALDGELGKHLARLADRRGWKLLAVWDAGMSDFSGNQDYSKLLNLSGMQFALWRADPLQQMELRALNTWSRVIRKNGVQRNAQQCIVDSRSTIPTQMRREHLARVHLDVTLTHDRYEGYVLAVAKSRWQKLTAVQHKHIRKILVRITRWERQQAFRQQQQALSALQRAGMQIHQMSNTQRRVFMLRMPPWRNFLQQINGKKADALLTAARTATATGRRGGADKKTLADSLQDTDTTK